MLTKNCVLCNRWPDMGPTVKPSPAPAQPAGMPEIETVAQICWNASYAEAPSAVYLQGAGKRLARPSEGYAVEAVPRSTAEAWKAEAEQQRREVERLTRELVLEKELSESRVLGWNNTQRQRDDLAAEVREWMCATCRTVYPGPPAEGLHCVVCPQCDKSACAPMRSVLLREARAEVAVLTERTDKAEAERDELARRLEALTAAVNARTAAACREFYAGMNAARPAAKAGERPKVVGYIPYSPEQRDGREGTQSVVLAAESNAALDKLEAENQQLTSQRDSWERRCRGARDNQEIAERALEKSEVEVSRLRAELEAMPRCKGAEHVCACGEVGTRMPGRISDAEHATQVAAAKAEGMREAQRRCVDVVELMLSNKQAAHDTAARAGRAQVAECRVSDCETLQSVIEKISTAAAAGGGSAQT